MEIIKTKTKKNKLSLFDLFSGIGGFTLALKPVCQTIAFCDNNKHAQSVLAKHFPQIPLFHDIKDINKTALKTKNIHKVDVISAGFPCQDISVMNQNGLGIQGQRSGLFFEIIRIAKILDASILILENSPNIINKGLDQVTTILQKNGYKFEYDIFSASDVGAPHIRRRFYMIAYKDNKNKQTIPKLIAPKTYYNRQPWEDVFHENKIIPHTQKDQIDLKKRTFLLGNSIVPLCARYAIFTLASKILHIKTHNILPKKHKIPTFHMKIPHHMYIPNKQIQKNQYIHKKYLSTPLSAAYLHTKIGSSRATRILQNQIMYNTHTLAYLQKQKNKNIHDYLINPKFIEWMMGYPLNWTKT